ncbi:MAG: QueT transporter family protein [Hydrogenoanaerobacterium sp.]
MKKINTKNITACAVIAAVYIVLSLAFAPISFGAVQFRVSEALTLLPVFSPYTIIGVTLGCLITNIAGVSLGVTMPPDILFGTFATFTAACLSYRLRRVCIKGLPVFSALAPVVINAVVIGWEITALFVAGESPVGFWAMAISVGAGEAVACLGLGLPLVYTLKKTRLDVKLFGED